jgi:hypothetical protein
MREEKEREKKEKKKVRGSVISWYVFLLTPLLKG